MFSSRYDSNQSTRPELCVHLYEKLDPNQSINRLASPKRTVHTSLSPARSQANKHGDLRRTGDSSGDSSMRQAARD